MLLSDAIAAYGADRRAKGVAAKTCSGELSVLTLFLSDVGNIQTKRIRPQHIDVFWVNRTTWAPGTLNKARAMLNNFFKWCQARGYMRRDMNPLEGSRARRVAPRNRIIIPQSEFSTLLAGLQPRARIVTAIGLYLFTRISEIEVLRWQDINLDTSTVEVFRPKTQTLDTLPICEELRSEIQRWRLEYAAVVGAPPQPGWFVIPGRVNGTRAGVKGVKGFATSVPPIFLPTKKSVLSRLVRETLEAAGYFQPHEGGHTFRRSGAVALYNQLSSVGHDRAIRVCQAMLGHSSIQTTEIYLRLDLDQKVRNDLLAGRRMFPPTDEATVLQLGGNLTAQR